MIDLNEKGFTLLELMVSVTIVGLLAAIALPEYQSVKGDVYNSVARSYSVNMRAAIEASLIDHEEDIEFYRSFASGEFGDYRTTKVQNSPNWSNQALKDGMSSAQPITEDDIVARLELNTGISFQVAHCKGRKSRQTRTWVQEEICIEEDGEEFCGFIYVHEEIGIPPIYGFFTRSDSDIPSVSFNRSILESCDNLEFGDAPGFFFF